MVAKPITGPLLSLFLLFPPAPGDYFKIKVIDQDTGRGVPLVELTTVNHVRHWTDSNGLVAFHEPGLMNRPVFFSVRSHGYQFTKDGFGFAGKQLTTTPGGSATLKIKRLNIAERLYRVTGAGIYADSMFLGEATPVKQPLLNAQVLGQDSVVNAIYKGKIYWFWGDTNRPSYPLGNYHVPGATSLLPKDGGLDPEIGVDLAYFVDKDGFAKPTAKMPGQGPTWITGAVTLHDPVSKQERLFAPYVRVTAGMKIYERGLLEFDDAKKEFTKLAQFDMKAPVLPDGHPFKHMENGVEYVYFAHPYPLVRVKATPVDLQNPQKYQAYTCFKQGSRADAPQLERDAAGKLRYGWKTATAPLTPKVQADLIKSGQMKLAEGLFQLREADTGKSVLVHNGSVYWNDYRRRWVLIVSESFGTSLLGEVWYAEADTPVGPWCYARKIVTHEKYSFYNPKQHPMFAKKGGRILFFEGTYTTTFSGNPDPTPRYDYNQIMYRLDLDDPRLILPVAVYLHKATDGGVLVATRDQLTGTPDPDAIAFFAPDRASPGTVPVLVKKKGTGVMLQVGTGKERDVDAAVVFYALPATAKERPKTTTALYEWVHADGRRHYGTDPAAKMPGFQRQEQPICFVWKKAE